MNPTPDKINGYKVVATLTLPDEEGSYPADLVICDRGDGTYIVWNYAYPTNGAPYAYCGRYDLTLADALRELARIAPRNFSPSNR